MINVGENPVLLMSSSIFSHDILPGAPMIGLLLVGGKASIAKLLKYHYRDRHILQIKFSRLACPQSRQKKISVASKIIPATLPCHTENLKNIRK